MSGCVPKKDFELEDLAVSKWNYLPIISNFALGSVGLTYLSDYEKEEDINYLIFALENAYVGKEVFKGKVFDQLISDLESLKDESINSECKFRNRLNEVFSKVPDGHLKASLSYHCQEDKEKQYKENLHFDIETKNSKSILVVRINSFLSDDSKKWQEFEDKFIRSLQLSDGLVIDLRENGGGYPIFPDVIASILYGIEIDNLNWMASREFPQPFDKIDIRGGRGYHYTLENGRKISNLFLKWNYEYPNYSSETEHSMMILKYHEDVEEIDPEKAYLKPIVLLYDRYCASSCERFLENMEEHPSVITMGHNSSGAIKYGNAGSLILKNSYIWVGLASGHTEYSDGRDVERVGYAPKVKLYDNNDSWVEIAIDNILGRVEGDN